MGTRSLLKDFNVAFHLPHEHLDPWILGFFLVGHLFCCEVRQGREEIKFSPEETVKISRAVLVLITGAFHLLNYLILDIEVAVCK